MQVAPRRMGHGARFGLGVVRTHPTSDLYDLGVDRRGPVKAGHADAVVAVAHEIVLADLVEAHGGQRDALVVRTTYAAPSATHSDLGRQKGFVVVPAPSDAANDLLDVDGPNPPVHLTPPPQCSFGRFEGEPMTMARTPQHPVPEAA
jgi:hypothetical protein